MAQPFKIVEREMRFWPTPRGSCVKRKVRGRLYDGIFEPIGEGVKWHMGIPELCEHPFDRIRWGNDFYASTNGASDHGACLDCGEHLVRYKL